MEQIILLVWPVTSERGVTSRSTSCKLILYVVVVLEPLQSLPTSRYFRLTSSLVILTKMHCFHGLREFSKHKSS